MNAGLARASFACCIGAAVATLAFMAWAASWSWSGLAFMVSLMAWCVSPYVPLGFASRKPRASRRGAVALLVTVIVVAGFAAVVYVDAFFIHLDAQGALVFLFVPVAQWVGALARHHRRRAPRTPGTVIGDGSRGTGIGDGSLFLSPRY